MAQGIPELSSLQRKAASVPIGLNIFCKVWLVWQLEPSPMAVHARNVQFSLNSSPESIQT